MCYSLIGAPVRSIVVVVCASLGVLSGQTGIGVGV